MRLLSASRPLPRVRPRRALPLLGALLALLLLVGCEEAVNPIFDTDSNFTLYGTLDMAQDVQYVRVIPLRTESALGAPRPLDADVVSIDLTTGERVVWRDSLIVFDADRWANVAYAPLRVQAGHTYRLEVTERATGEVTSVETTVPARPDPVRTPPTLSGAGTFPAQATQNVRWDGLGHAPFQVDVWYRFFASPNAPFVDVRIPREQNHAPGPPVSWNVTLDLRKDRMALDTLTAVESLPLAGIALQLTVLDDQFVPPGGVFDPELLAQPGAFSNVKKGFGFVGSVGRFSTEWLLPEDAAQRLRYLTFEEVYGKRAPTLRALLDQLRHASPLAFSPLRPTHPGGHPGL